ncbi:MAG TPA: hypothetical protein VLJ41_08180 [Segetibacter sp.]|nr:hypothetical protein [Segetibacter sp.]
MKKVRLSLAALTLVLAIAGTTTANATKTKGEAFPCYQVDPDGAYCTNSSWVECCETEDHQILTERGLED